MSQWLIEASWDLATAEDLKAAIAEPSWMDRTYPFGWRVRSQWLIDLIEERERTDPNACYNAAIQREAERRLGLPAMDDNGSPLSQLIYNARSFRRCELLVARGYRPLTQAMVDEAGAGGKIEAGGKELNVRNLGGKLYAMKPGARKFCAMLDGQPAKILKTGKKAAA